MTHRLFRQAGPAYSIHEQTRAECEAIARDVARDDTTGVAHRVAELLAGISEHREAEALQANPMNDPVVHVPPLPRFKGDNIGQVTESMRAPVTAQPVDKP